MAAASRKYAFLVGDGMADYPLQQLQGRTPLEAARTPNLDRVAGGRIGLARTIPEGFEPGSDVANLSLLGYDPQRHHTRRGPFEAASMGVPLTPEQVAFRMNLVTLDHRAPEEIIMVSHSSGDISTPEAHQIVATLQERLQTEQIHIHPGVAYRHLLVWDGGPADLPTIPPHDRLGQNMAGYLAASDNDPVVALTRRSWEILREHPVNMRRRREGLKEANSIWLWGQDHAPRLPSFQERFGLRGGVISAVDLIKGIGVYAGFQPIAVDGATGYLDTNYLGKGQKAVEALEDLDFVFVHVEAPDEAGHAGSAREKIQAIEAFDELVVGTVLKGMTRFADFRVLVASDHLTPIAVRTHTPEPTPFAWIAKAQLERPVPGSAFSERAAAASGRLFERGHDLMPAFLSDA